MDLRKYVAVQQKISCVFMTGIQDVPSSKRTNQSFKVAATDQLHANVVPEDIEAAFVSEKIDGTCCLIQQFQGLIIIVIFL